MIDNDKAYVILLFGIMLGMIIYHVLEANTCQMKCEEFMIEQQCICVYDNNYKKFNNSIKYFKIPQNFKKSKIL